MSRMFAATWGRFSRSVVLERASILSKATAPASEAGSTRAYYIYEKIFELTKIFSVSLKNTPPSTPLGGAAGVFLFAAAVALPLQGGKQPPFSSPAKSEARKYTALYRILGEKATVYAWHSTSHIRKIYKIPLKNGRA